MSETRDVEFIKYKTNIGTIAICDYSLSTALMRLVGTRGNGFIVKQRKLIYCYYLL